MNNQNTLAISDSINGKALTQQEVAILVKMNEQMAHVTMGGKNQIITTGFDGRNCEIKYKPAKYRFNLDN